MSAIIGKIASIEGTFYVKGLDGSLREVSEGYEILEGESIVGDKSNSSADNIIVSITDGTDIVIVGDDKQLFDSSLSAQEFAQEDTVTEKDSIQSMLEESGDIENIEDLETAAGEEGAAKSTEGGEAVFTDVNNASADINADLRQRAFEEEDVIDRDSFERILLIDNHAPIGYHIHPDPKNPKEKVKIEVKSPFEALELLFFRY